MPVKSPIWRAKQGGAKHYQTEIGIIREDHNYEDNWYGRTSDSPKV